MFKRKDATKTKMYQRLPGRKRCEAGQKEQLEFNAGWKREISREEVQQIKITALQEVHGEWLLSIREEVQIRARPGGAEEEQWVKLQIQDKGMREFQKQFVLHLWGSVQLHPRQGTCPTLELKWSYLLKKRWCWNGIDKKSLPKRVKTTHFALMTHKWSNNIDSFLLSLHKL